MPDGLIVKNSLTDNSPYTLNESTLENQVTGGHRWLVGDYHELHCQLEHFMQMVLTTNQLPFRFKAIRNRYVAIGNSPLTGGVSFSTHLKRCWTYMDLYWEGYAYSPDFQLFFDCMRTFPPMQLSRAERLSDPSAMLPDGTLLGERFNAFVEYIRVKAREQKVAKRISNWKANVVAQERTIRDYLEATAQHYDHIVPIRFDLRYEESVAVESDSLPRTTWEYGRDEKWESIPSDLLEEGGRLETRGRLDPCKIMEDRERFIDRTFGGPQDLFAGMVGFVMKLERGGASGAYHLHVLLLFDGAKAARVEILIDLVCRRWAWATRGTGMIFDCHAEDYKARLQWQGRWDLSPIRNRDEGQIRRLTAYIMRYFAKTDEQLVRVKPTARSRTLTTGRRRSSAPNAGLSGDNSFCRRRL